LLLDEFDILEHGWFRFNFFPWRLFWPLLLLGLGIYFVTSGTSISKTAGDVKQWARESRISKSREDKMLAGVCGGLARYFNIDSSVIRIIAVIVAIFSGGLGVLAYIVMALIFPFADEVPGGSGREAENGNGPSSKG
jgi:phage shock protein PspC (stress-responsive transcriptional regulator)